MKLYTPSKDESEEQELAESRTKRSNNSFKLLGIEIGENLSFLYDDSIVARVADNKNQVEYNGKIYSITRLAINILIDKYGWSENLHANGWRFFTKDGITLSDLRDRIEIYDNEN